MRNPIRHRAKILCISALLLCTTLQASANADEADEYGPLNALYKCAKIKAPETRLACYDKEVGRIKTAEDKKELVAIDAKAARKIKKEAFGFHIPSLPKLGLPKIGGNTKTEALTAKVKSVRRSGRKYIITLENGQVWQETGGRLNYIPKGDLTATIKPKSMGSFVISLNNGKTTVRGLRVKRVQ